VGVITDYSNQCWLNSEYGKAFSNLSGAPAECTRFRQRMLPEVSFQVISSCGSRKLDVLLGVYFSIFMSSTIDCVLYLHAI